MVRKLAEVIKIKQFEEQMTDQAKNVMDGYENIPSMWRMFFNEYMKVLDNQMEYCLAMELGFLDLIKMMTRIHPDIKEMNTNMFPFLVQLDYLDTLQKEIIDLKKAKAHKRTKSIKSYHKQAANKTLDAFDKYCDLLSAV